MSSYEYIKGKGNRFTSDNQPANRGRKPKLYTIAKKSYGITLDEFKEVVNYLWQLPKDEVREIAERGDTPIWMANVCRSLYKDTSKGVMNTLRELVQLMFGKELATRVDVTTNGKDIGQRLVFSPTPLTEQDIKEIKEIQHGDEEGGSDTGISEA
ncbi:putative uncharacterized protein [Prevotella sp. CAG:1320]|nr:putative uncharacterized protein [Prevotella sp. CAG:1320]